MAKIKMNLKKTARLLCMTALLCLLSVKAYAVNAYADGLSVQEYLNYRGSVVEAAPSVYESLDVDGKKLYLAWVAYDAAQKLGVSCSITYYNDPTQAAFAYVDLMEPGVVHINEAMMLSNDAVRAETIGITVDQYVQSLIAHEVRHIYQHAHMNDETPYGEAVRKSFLYKSAAVTQPGSLSDVNWIFTYLYNWREMDARQYGWQYIGLI